MSGPSRPLPVIPPRPPVPQGPRDETGNPAVAVCGACGVTIHAVMHFSCGRSDCPVQRRTVAALAPPK